MDRLHGLTCRPFGMEIPIITKPMLQGRQKEVIPLTCLSNIFGFSNFSPILIFDKQILIYATFTEMKF